MIGVEVNKIKDFKNIADDIMKDIKVDEELRNKTFEKCLKKESKLINKILILAASFLLIIGIVNIYNSLLLKNKENKKEIDITMNSDDTDIYPENSTNILNVKEEKEWVIDTIDEAKVEFGDFYLTPMYLPEDYKIQEISAWGLEEGHATRIISNYFSERKSFIIIQEEGQISNEFGDFEEVDINGSIGYIKTDRLTGIENEDGVNTQLHWFNNEVHYLIQGLITKEDAIKIAISMK